MIGRLLFALSLLITPLLVAVPVSAQVNPFEPVCDERTSDAGVCVTDGSDPLTGNDGVFYRVVLMLGWVVGFVAVLMILIAAIKYITANGDAAAVKSARDTIIYAMIGVAIFASSQIIVRFILSSL